MRPSFDQYFMNMCDLVSTRATCDRKNVGSVIVRDKRIIATGFNGSIPGLSHCSDPLKYIKCHSCKGSIKVEKENLLPIRDSDKFLTNIKSCPLCKAPIYSWNEFYLYKGGHLIENNSCQRVIHSEINAITQAARLGISTEGCTIYCNLHPCWNCFKVIVAAGIIEIVYKEIYKPDIKISQAVEELQREKPFIFRQYIPS